MCLPLRSSRAPCGVRLKFVLRHCATRAQGYNLKRQMTMHKKLALLLACGLGLSILHCSHEALSPSQFSAFSNAEDSSLPDSMRRAYYEDAARLALRELERTRDLATEPVELPAELVQTFYEALILVHNAVDLPARDAVVEAYAIHTFLHPELYSLVLSADTTRAWVKALRRGETVTGEPQVDKLLHQYELSLRRQSFVLDFFILQTKQPLNLPALARKFSEIAGVYSAYPDSWIGGDRDIHANLESRAIGLRYEYGWGDCPSGCIDRHYWQFFVHEDGRVEFAGEEGSPLPKKK